MTLSPRYDPNAYDPYDTPEDNAALDGRTLAVDEIAIGAIAIALTGDPKTDDLGEVLEVRPTGLVIGWWSGERSLDDPHDAAIEFLPAMDEEEVRAIYAAAMKADYRYAATDA